MLVLFVEGERYSEETFSVSKTILCQTNFKLQNFGSVGVFLCYLINCANWPCCSGFLSMAGST